ncbi:kelch repeat-containing protein [Sphingobacterium faecium]|jgi:N-acetylneuraminic acid mutarotase|uniref:Kelch repeat-containing protein n=1 Tax=Sphingobacterium faecium TaxID=34087 RepID=UPI0032095BD1
MNKKNWLLIILACVVTFSTYSCKSKDKNDEDEVVEWTRASAFDGDARSGAVSFLVNNIAYVTTGLSKEGQVDVRKTDTWAYSPSAGTWSQKAAFPGAPRNNAVAFAIGDNGYVGTGYDGSNALSDFYKYDTKNNTWTKIADLPAEARFGAVAFSIGGFGYVGTGSRNNTDNNVKSFYKYNPTTNEWSAVDSPLESNRRYGFAFVINNIAYVGGGVDNSSYPEDFFKYDGTKWTKLNNLNRNDNSYTYNLTRSNTATFVLNNLAYVVGGVKQTVINTIWEYNPTTDVWNADNQVFQGQARQDAVGFGIDNVGYVTTGQNGSNKYYDTWKFVPVK